MIDQAAFIAEAERDLFGGFAEKSSCATEPNDPHTHPFDVRILVLEGSFRLTCGAETRLYPAGDTFTLLANTEHQESFPPSGARWIVSTRTYTATVTQSGVADHDVKAIEPSPT